MVLDMEGVRTKVQHGKGGQRGGVLFSRGALYWLLSNPIYIGKLRHKDKLHDGQHDGIVPAELWEAVQAKLRDSAAERGKRTIGSGSALLMGMVRDSAGRPMSPSSSVKGGRRYHYYVSSISKDRVSASFDPDPVPDSNQSWMEIRGSGHRSTTAPLQRARSKKHQMLKFTVASG